MNHEQRNFRIFGPDETLSNGLGALFETTQRQWDAAVKHCTEGIGIWQWASNDQGLAPDVVMACCGDVPTLETLEQNEGHLLGDALKVGMTSATATNSGK